MSGTKEGAKKGTATLKAKDPDHFKKIGSIGGRKTAKELRPFYLDRELARSAGIKGGKVTRPKVRFIKKAAPIHRYF